MGRFSLLVGNHCAVHHSGQSTARNVNKSIDILRKSMGISTYLRRKATFTMYVMQNWN